MRDKSVWHHLATNPNAMVRFQSIGRQPSVIRNESTPLLTALDALGPRYRCCLRGFMVDHRLGYSGRRVFYTADHAFRWLGGYNRRRYEGQTPPVGASWVDPRFRGPVTWSLMKECVSGAVPDGLEREIVRILGM